MVKTEMNETKNKPFILRLLGIFGSRCFYGSLALIIASLVASMMGAGRSVRILGYSPYFIETYSMESEWLL